MSENRTLFQLTADMAAIEDELIENGGELTPELEALMVATEEALTAKADGYNLLLRKLKAEEATCDTEQKYWAGKKKVVQNAQKRIREHITDVMQMGNIGRIEGQHCKISRRMNESIEVNEEVLLGSMAARIQELVDSMPEFVKVDVSVNKTALKDWISRENIIPEGVGFKYTPSITIK
jgi:hypothetical protein